MAGIEDLITVYRGDDLLYDKTLNKKRLVSDPLRAKKTGRFGTTSSKYASSYARKFPNVVRSVEISPKESNIGQKLFNKTHFKIFDNGSDFYKKYYGDIQILSKKNKAKLKVDVLKTFMSNAKALTPLAAKGLQFISSLPVATISMILQSTPANADEVNMTLEDFAKLNKGSTNVDKALPSEPKDI